MEDKDIYEKLAEKNGLWEEPKGTNIWHNKGGLRFILTPLGFTTILQKPIAHKAVVNTKAILLYIFLAYLAGFGVGFLTGFWVKQEFYKSEIKAITQGKVLMDMSHDSIVYIKGSVRRSATRVLQNNTSYRPIHFNGTTDVIKGRVDSLVYDKNTKQYKRVAL